LRHAPVNWGISAKASHWPALIQDRVTQPLFCRRHRLGVGATHALWCACTAHPPEKASLSPAHRALAGPSGLCRWADSTTPANPARRKAECQHVL